MNEEVSTIDKKKVDKRKCVARTACTEMENVHDGRDLFQGPGRPQASASTTVYWLANRMISD